MKLVMVGAGYVGLVTGVCFSNTGHEVTCVDLDEDRVDRLRRGECPIFEPGLTDLMRLNTQAGRLHFSTDLAQACRDAEAIFICVGTPSNEDGEADLRYVYAAAEDIAKTIKSLGPGQRPKTVVVKSTVPVGASHDVQRRIREIVGDIPFHIANNPEFLKEGDAVNDFNRPDRVVVGVEDERTGELMRDLYEPYLRQGNPIYIMDVRSSEMVKYASNAMLATKISFVNEIARLCEAFGADINNVRQGMCADKRIGRQFLFPGLGYGGSCFPKDVRACVTMGRRTGRPTVLLAGVHAVNEGQRELFFQKIEDHFADRGGLSGRTLAFWGLAFKPRTDDVREAPALTLIRRAIDAGARIRAHDPVALDTAREALGRDAFTPCPDMYETMTGADALVICTDWDEFKAPDLDRLRESLRERVVFDGRNLYRPQSMARAGLTYYSVGRAPAGQV